MNWAIVFSTVWLVLKRSFKNASIINGQTLYSQFVVHFTGLQKRRAPFGDLQQLHISTGCCLPFQTAMRELGLAITILLRNFRQGIRVISCFTCRLTAYCINKPFRLERETTKPTPTTQFNKSKGRIRMTMKRTKRKHRKGSMNV